MNWIKAIPQVFWVASFYSFLVLFVIGIWCVNLASLLVSPFLPRERARHVLRGLIHGMVNLYISLMVWCGPLKTNRDRLATLARREGGALIIANHPSMLDAPIFLSRIPGLVCVFKSALKQGLLLPATAKKLGYLSNDEGMDMLREMDTHLKSGDRILVFPEGTRTNQPVLNSLNKGYALAALRAAVPVHLVAVRSETPLLSKRQHFLKAAKFPVSFHFEIGPTIEPGEFQSVNQLNAFAEGWLRESLVQPPGRPHQFLPANTKRDASGEQLRARFKVPGTPFYCRGHMPGMPLVPAYVQMAWIRELAECLAPGEPVVLDYTRLKFLKPVRPGDEIELALEPTGSGGKVLLHCGGEPVTRGTVDFIAQEARTPAFKPIVVIPSYNTGGDLLITTVLSARSAGHPVVVAIDGSTDGSDAELREAVAGDREVKVLRRESNSGKGETVRWAVEYAFQRHYTHALVMDSDGQHPHEAIGEMLAKARENPDAIIMGQPAFGPDAPWARVYGRRLSTFWTNVATLWCGLGDTLFGMRVYPTEPFLKAFAQTPFARGFDFDPEIAVRMAWLGCRPVPHPVPVRYLKPEEGGVSHFHYVRDNIKLTLLHFRMVSEFLIVRLLPFLRRKNQWKKAS